MKRLLHKILITSFVLFLGTMHIFLGNGTEVMGAEGENLLINGGGELGMYGWTDMKEKWNTTEEDDNTDKDNAVEGNYFFWPAEAKEDDETPPEMYQEVNISKYEAGTWLQLSAWMSVYDSTPYDEATLTLEILDSRDKLIAIDEVSLRSPEWTWMVVSIKVPENAQSAKVICKGKYYSGIMGDVDAYFDDIQLRVVDAPYREIQITGDAVNGKVGDFIKLKASDGVNSNASDYIWSSSYDKYAMVDEKGSVIIRDSSSEVIIYARNKSTGIVGSYKINSNQDVIKVDDTALNFNPATDGNSFSHSNKKKSSDDETKLVGFLGRTKYEFSNPGMFEILTQNASEGNKAYLKTIMNKDWGGSCYGVSATIALVKMGKMDLKALSDDIKNVPKSYYNLKRPADNTTLSDWINYLQLSQYLEYGGKKEIAVAKTYNKAILSERDLRYDNYDSLEIFLKKMVSYASNDHVCVLCMGYYKKDNEGIEKESGHAILVTRCEKEENGKYKIYTYDINNFDYSSKIGSEKELMEIEADFSGFTGGSDYNLCNPSSGEYKYRFFYLIDAEDLYQYVVEQKKHNTEVMLTCIVPNLKNKFKMYDSLGGHLAYDGTSFSGNIEIQGIDFIVNDSDEIDGGDGMVIYIKPVDGLVFKDLSEESDISVYTDDNFVSFSGKNIEEAKIDFGKGIELKGTNMEFETYVLAEDDEETGKDLNLIKVSGNVASDIDISIDGSDLAVNTEGTLENVTTAALSGTETVERAFTGVTGEFKIDSDAKVDNATEIAMVRTEGLTTIDTSGDIGVLGVSTTTNSKNISQAVIKLSKDTYTYNGKKKKPTITVELGDKVLTASKDYKVSYKNNKNVGTATLTIKGIGDYNGTVSRTFKIVPKATSLSKISASGETISVKWKKQTKSVTGYEIQYSTSKSFTKKTTETVTVAGAKKTKTTISGLKSGKKYYARVRTYKVVNGKKYYSGWSKVKNVKVK